MSELAISSVVAAIRSSFSSVAVPDAERLVPGSSGEDLEIKRVFRKRNWMDIPNAELIGNQNALSFFTPEAFRYFLPAFMRALIEDIDAADTLKVSLVLRLTLPTEIDSVRVLHLQATSDFPNPMIQKFIIDEIASTTARVHYFIEVMSGLTRSQGVCIHMFLKELYNMYPRYFPNREPVTAIERYWFQFSLS